MTSPSISRLHQANDEVFSIERIGNRKSAMLDNIPCRIASTRLDPIVSSLTFF
jgi:hypothetical protein